MTGAMINRLYDRFVDLCQKWDGKMIEFNGEADHVHLLFQYYPQMSLPKFVNSVKSVSSRRIRQEFSDEINAIYWKDVFWNKFYFIASCGGVTVSTLRKYVEGQDTPD